MLNSTDAKRLAVLHVCADARHEGPTGGWAYICRERSECIARWLKAAKDSNPDWRPSLIGIDESVAEESAIEYVALVPGGRRGT